LKSTKTETALLMSPERWRFGVGRASRTGQLTFVNGYLAVGHQARSYLLSAHEHYSLQPAGD